MRLRSNHIVLKDQVQSGVLEIEDGVITGIFSSEVAFDVDYQDRIIAPGLIDIHNHGYAGWSFTQTLSNSDLQGLLKRLLAEGVTSMLATASSGAFSLISDLIQAPTMDTEILGIHMEGPFLNPQQHGAAPPGTLFKTPDVSLIEAYQKQATGKLRMVTIAPEVQGNLEIIDWLHQHQIKVAVGHTNASYKELKAIQDKISSLTHLGNAMSGIHHREIGTFGFGLKEDVYVELIGDGIHISEPMLDLIFRIKKPSDIILISDTVGLAGCLPGDYQTAFGFVHLNEQGLIMNEFGHIAGSSRTLLEDIRYLYHTFSFDLPRLFQMASLNPATFLGLSDRGLIEIGKQADLLVLDPDLQIEAVYKKGQLRYKQGDSKTSNQDQLEHYLNQEEFFNYYSL